MKQTNTIANTREVKTIISLGSNLGDREKNLQTAIKLISSLGKITKKSSIYQSQPVGYLKQQDFLNQVIEFKTTLSAQELLQNLKSIEIKMGRVKSRSNGPRTIDLDILLYSTTIHADKDLTIPHPRLHQRRFILEPLAEILPKMRHPVIEKSIEELLKNLTSRTDRTDKLHFRVSGGIRQSRITVLLSSRARAGRAGRRFRRTFFDARR